MLIAKKHDDDLAEFFKYELAPYPLSMFNETTCSCFETDLPKSCVHKMVK
ncbi:hypothetical protein ALC62_03231 [Cyphomyrmex costatus]|uniref:Uncharacterized protein n=1 Tax=Cyphomyrmex costatus TaxID=456900 RepID=A0A151ILR9_9HYME|nr:hypothetical protein ALC62_03231 [Cyphomyrmex costatus]